MIQLIPFLVIYVVIAVLYYRNKKTSFIQQIIHLSFFIYVLLVIGNSLLPLPVSERYIQMSIEQGTEGKNNIIPFSDIFQIINNNSLNGIISQLVNNLILLSPLGFYAPLIWRKFKNMKSIIFLGMIVSVGIASTQFIISTIISFTYRGFIIDNIILNTIGVVIGFLILKLISPLLKKSAGQYDVQNEWFLNTRRDINEI